MEQESKHTMKNSESLGETSRSHTSQENDLKKKKDRMGSKGKGVSPLTEGR